MRQTKQDRSRIRKYLGKAITKCGESFELSVFACNKQPANYGCDNVINQLGATVTAISAIDVGSRI
jgi:hypothetical protein